MPLFPNGLTKRCSVELPYLYSSKTEVPDPLGYNLSIILVLSAQDNSKEYRTLNNIELSEDEINTLHESRKKMIDETIKQAGVAGGI